MWFSLLPCTLEYGTEASHHFEYSVELDATPEQIFDLIVEPDPWTEWFPHLLGAEWTSAPPRGVDSSRVMKAFLASVHERFIAYERGVRFAFYVDRSEQPLFLHFMEDFHLDDLGDGRCRLRWYLHYQPRTFARLLLPVLFPIFAKRVREGTANMVRWVRENPQRLPQPAPPTE